MKKILCLLMAVIIVMSAFPAFADSFTGFAAQNLYMGSLGPNFRVVVPLNLVEGVNPDNFKDKKIEVSIINSGETTASFESVVSGVEVDDSRWVVVVPAPENVKIQATQDLVTAGGRLSIRIFNDKGEAPETTTTGTPAADKPSQSAPANFEAFTVEGMQTGMAGSSFRFVVPASKLPVADAGTYKNKKIEYTKILNDTEEKFVSVISSVEVRNENTEFVLVVPEARAGDAKVLKLFQDAGGKFKITIFPVAGEMPKTEASAVIEPTTPAGSTSQTTSGSFEAFTVTGMQTGMAEKVFRFVVPASKLPTADAELYKNKKIEYIKVLNGNEEKFVSVITSVEARKENTEFVMVVPEARAGDANALKAFQNAGGAFRITIYPVAGEKPKVEASDPIVIERPKSDVDFASLPDYGNIFAPYLTKQAPEILETKSETAENGLIIKEIFYSSYDGNNKIYARIFSPDKQGKFPGVVLYHGGSGNADNFKDLALFLAANDYVVVTPELPGIGDPNKMQSEGPFKALGYSQQAQIGRIQTDPKDSSIYQGVISAIDAFYLLKNLDNVDGEKLGISGGSWGGYTTTKIAGLLGDDVSCAYSRYGCAYYDAGTHWSKNVFPSFPEISEKLWMKYLDASVDIANITAPYFIEAPTNDAYFFPDAVQKTLDNIKGYKNKAFTANLDHVVLSDHFTQALGFFDYYLKNSGKSLVTASGISTAVRADGAIDVTFNVPADRKIEAELVYADADIHWNEKKWSKIPAKVNNGVVTATLPPHLYFKNTVLYGYVTDENKFYASTDMATINGLTPKALTDEELINFLGDTIVVNETDEEATKNGTWTKSSLTGYEAQSVFAGTKSATITYTPLLKAGKYKVSAFVIIHQNNQKNLKATVNHANGTDEKLISTNIPQSGWVEIGEYDFVSGRVGNVVLGAGDETAGDANPIRLDAVKFDLIEEVEDPNEIKVILNGTKLKFPDDQKSVIVEGRTLVAFRTIFEALGLSVNWISETSTAMGEKEGMKIELPIGNTVATINGVQKTTDVPAQLINSRTFVPLRFLSEALGFEVSWDGDTKTVTISEK